ncbi:MAG: hypothetical protein MJE63_00845 [Proteobacteria bacterium]|nr:hypothetical protein [Pseudomonadota bacterium]
MKDGKIMLVASQGGHWVQLIRLLPAFTEKELVLISTFDEKPVLDCQSLEYLSVCDASRWSKFKMLKQLIQVFYLVIIHRPRFILTTGASIGVWAIVFGKMIGAKTIWLDSIANYRDISMSGKLVKRISDIHLTQWKHLTDDITLFKGSVL